MLENEALISEIKAIYEKIKPDILKRINEFRSIWIKKNSNQIYQELVFCLLTPQSSAKMCWLTVEDLQKKDLLYCKNQDLLSNELNRVRFKNNKARYIIELQQKFSSDTAKSIIAILEEFDNSFDRRKWLFDNIKGMGMKEASHFLRNIGLGEDLAILDRHILRNLLQLAVIERIVKSMSEKIYLEIEQKMREFAYSIKIPLDHLDFVLWYKATGIIFK
jgi:N-glycosylase/DNA lyase